MLMDRHNISFLSFSLLPVLRGRPFQFQRVVVFVVASIHPVILCLVHGVVVEDLGELQFTRPCKFCFDSGIVQMMPIRPSSMVVGPAPRAPRLMSISTVVSSLHDEEAGREHGKTPPPGFKPSLRLYLAFLTLAVITMAVALDGTSISVALPVSLVDFI